MMRKEIEVTTSITEVFCDKCKNEITGWAVSGMTCAICRSDVCPDCQGDVYQWRICNECQKENRELITEIEQNEGSYRVRRIELGQRLRELMDF